jgi:hypothetical protein
MRVVLWVFVLLASPALAAAQDQQSLPRTELFFGYQLQHTPFDGRFLAPADGANAPDIAFDWNVTDRVGFIVTSPRLGVARDPTRGTRVDYAFLAGTRVRFAERGRWTPHASVLAGPIKGGVVDRVAQLRLNGFYSSPQFTALQVAIGAGVDVRVNDRWAIRVVDVRGRRIVTGPATDNMVAVSTGAVVRFGSR